ncbi:MAG: hypothetical protein CBB97_00435 [Candidatus Endolissoclinum sp. TMED37]|nr:MAG: hypothetical protein CBB97_00435 [Candidatus Endolissoclinum sp. TMED37]|tara:strand:- start:471 stop:704 length:234 start_codon:yes stop_codon:yes gene_type:complete
MKMNRDEYDRLIKKFALELSEVGVTENAIKIVQAQYERVPNVPSSQTTETTDRFTYMHNGYEITATRTISLQVKKCK